MKQQEFEQRYQSLWQQLEQTLDTKKDADLEQFPQQYRRVCHHLAIAKNRRYSPYLVDRLNHLVMKSHHRLYRHNARFNFQILRFLLFGFPQALRDNSRYVWSAIGLLFVPGLLMFLLCYANDEIIYSLMSPEQVRQYESMYDPSARALGRERESDTDIFMFGFYIKNNISVSFQTFAGGMVFGLGSIFYLLFNGLLMGATAGHLTQVGFTETFFPFVVGHGAFELTAIAFSGAAGLKIGFALIDPGPYSRLKALQHASRDAIKIIYGTTLMLVIAAFLEAFWSSSTTLTPNIKYSVGGVLWLLVILYCVFAGRGRVHGSE